MKKKTKTLIAIFVVLGLIVGSISGVIIYVKSNLKPSKAFLRGEVCGDIAESCELTPFVVDEGAYGKTTLQKLETEGILKDSNIVYYWNRILGGYSFYAGYYEIPHKIDGRDITLEELLNFLSKPENAHQDTVIIKLDEGDFARSFAEDITSVVTLKENPIDDDYGKVQTLLNYWNNEDAIRGLMDDYPFLTEELFEADHKVLLEGYLFPDTYEFFEYTTCEEITRKIFDRTLEIYEKYQDEFESSSLTTHQIFTLASIVQWETGSMIDGPVVAGVFLNRMENPTYEGIGGRLQSTVTACYAFDLTKSECDEVGDAERYTQTDNEYNTYTIEGLPPGPVCCPNEIAFYSALNPDQSSGYYYFVADMCNGGTAFARTYAQQLYNTEKLYIACAN